VGHDSSLVTSSISVLVCGTWLIHMSAMTHSLGNITHSHVGHDSSLVTSSISVLVPLTEEISLQIFGSRDLTIFLWVTGAPFTHVKNLCEILWTPVKTCLVCTGTPVKTCWKLWQSSWRTACAHSGTFAPITEFHHNKTGAIRARFVFVMRARDPGMITGTWSGILPLGLSTLGWQPGVDNRGNGRSRLKKTMKELVNDQLGTKDLDMV